MGFSSGGVWIASASEALQMRSPIVGSPHDAWRAKEVMLQIESDAKDYITNAEYSIHALMFTSSDASHALMAKTENGLLRGAKDVRSDAKVAASAFGKFAKKIERIHQDARTVLSDTDAELLLIAESARSLSSAAARLGLGSWSYPHNWSLSPSPNPPSSEKEDPNAEEEWRRRAFVWDGANNRIVGRKKMWSGLVEDRKQAESELASALNGTKLGQISKSMDGKPHKSSVSVFFTGAHLAADSYGEYSDLAELVFADGLSPEEIAQRWHDMGYTENDLRNAPPELLFGLAGMVAIPSAIQNFVARRALSYAEEFPESAYRMMGFADTDKSLKSFTSDISDLRRELTKAENIVKPLKSSTIQFIGFGRHEDRMTAGFVLGNLDTASTFGINVSGMFSSVNDMGTTFQGTVNIRESAEMVKRGDYAVVHWIGYESPNLVSVMGMEKANAGGQRLAGFIDGIFEQRTHSGVPISNSVVYAHSYGSTTAVEALKLTQHQVGHLVTYGSAGIEKSTVFDDLNVGKVHATHADGDGVAGIGRDGSGRLDPRNLDGQVEVFSSEEHGGLKKVTVHDMYAEPGSWSIFNPTKTGYLSGGTSSVDHMGQVLAGEK